MKATELRIGNHIQWNNPKNEIEIIRVIGENVVGLNSDIPSDTLTPLDFFKPIPLTEEWLLKFGFEKKEDLSVHPGSRKYYFFYVKNNLILSISNVTDFNIEFKFQSFDAACYLSIKLQYVHQLQNLCFALTNEELTIKK